MTPVRIAAWIVLAVGLAFTVGYGVAGPFVAEMAAERTFADLLGRGRLRALGLNLAALTVLPLAFVTWHLALRNWLSLVALLLAVLGSGLTLPGVGYLVFILPKSIAALDTADAYAFNAAVFADIPFVASLALSGLFSTAAYLTAGIALWRHGIYRRWALAAFMAASPLLSFAPTVPDVDMIFPVDMLGALLLLTAGAGMSFKPSGRSDE